jgi:hypothetical protein
MFVEKKVFEILSPVYAQWQAKQGYSHPPILYSPLCPVDGVTADALVITLPLNGETFLIEPGYDLKTQTLQLRGEVDPFLPEVDWLMDGKKIATVSWPYETDWQLTRGKHRLEMAGGGMKSDPVEFEVF